ncbi:hypothetical protein GCM10029992_49790 [Glycomyces albus]
MIILGAGTNQWFHGDTMYRAFFTLLLLTGCQGVNGGGWAHYVGQEKCRTQTGWATYASAMDWNRPARFMAGTAYWYLHTDQWRYDTYNADALTSATGTGALAGKHTADLVAASARMGWMPSYPTFDRNPRPRPRGGRSGQAAGEYVAEQLASGELRFSAEDPDAPENWPRVLTVWRANLLGSSAKGNEYFLRHLLGTAASVQGAEAGPEHRPEDVTWRDGAPEETRPAALPGLPDDQHHLDVGHRAARGHLVREARPVDHRHASVRARLLPGDRPALAGAHRLRGVPVPRGAVLGARRGPPRHRHRPRGRAAPARHPGRTRPARRHRPDWKHAGATPVPGSTMPNIVAVERDYPAVAAKLAAIGPLAETAGLAVKGVSFTPTPRSAGWPNATAPSGPDRPRGGRRSTPMSRSAR